jgi:DNA helicase-2/ATP-dependent DNA helicase PcrA
MNRTVSFYRRLLVAYPSSTLIRRNTRLFSVSNDKLSQVQQDSVTSPLNTAAICISGPGSGKTKVLTNRIAYLIKNYEQYASSILALTFTNKAANEMKERVNALMNDQNEVSQNSIFIGTFHSFCSIMLRTYGNEYLSKLTNSTTLNSKFLILDNSESTRILSAILKEKGISLDKSNYSISVLLNAVNKIRMEQLLHSLNLIHLEDFIVEKWKETPDLYNNMNVYDLARGILPEYLNQCYNMNAFDFEDLIIYGFRLLNEVEEARQKVQNRYRHVLIDEYQDTNILQYELIKLLSPAKLLDNVKVDTPSRSLFIVGDENQSIYGFRGAAPGNINKLSQNYNTLHSYSLLDNYRCSSGIAYVANSIIGKTATKSININLYDPVRLVNVNDNRQESEVIIKILDKLKNKSQNIAILYRTNDMSRVLEEQFIRAGIKYKILGNIKFYERKEIKDILCYLRLLVNPYDIMAFTRIVNIPQRGIGSVTEDNFISWYKTTCEIIKNDMNTNIKNINLLDFLSYLQRDMGVPVTCANYQYESTVSNNNDEILDLIAQHNCPLSAREKKLLVTFADIIGQLLNFSNNPSRSISDITRHVIAVIKYNEYISSFCKSVDEERDRIINIDELLRSTMQFESNPPLSANDMTEGNATEMKESSLTGLSGLQSFVETTNMFSKEDINSENSDNGDNNIVLMTIHASKGMEFDSVFVVGCNEGILPHYFNLKENSVDEERRLFYVAVTRAKKVLFLMVRNVDNQYSTDKQKQKTTKPSRFLSQLLLDSNNSETKKWFTTMKYDANTFFFFFLAGF